MSILRRSMAMCAAAGGLAACGGHDATTPAPARATSERFTVQPREVADLKPVAAVVTSRDLGEARARIPGTLVELKVKEGDLVSRGQVIARVADARIGLQTQAYGAQAAAAAAEAGRADAELSRIRDLYAHGVYAKARLEQAEASARGARGQLAAARAQQAASAELGAQGAVLAPASGRVLTADTPAGSFVAAGQSVAAIATGETVLRIEAPESVARSVAVGTSLTISDPNYAGPRTAQVTQVYPSVAGGQVRIDAALPGAAPTLVGARTTVLLPAGRRTALTVPRRFVSSRFGVDYVRVLAADGSASETPVQLAPAPMADQAEVLSGLSAGDVIVAAKAAESPAR